MYFSGQCPHFITPENTKKKSLFWVFMGYKIETLTRNGLTDMIQLQLDEITTIYGT